MLKVKAIYLNYNERTCRYYYTIYLVNGDKLYVDYSHIENVKKNYELKNKELENNK